MPKNNKTTNASAMTSTAPTETVNKEINIVTQTTSTATRTVLTSVKTQPQNLGTFYRNLRLLNSATNIGDVFFKLPETEQVDVVSGYHANMTSSFPAVTAFMAEVFGARVSGLVIETETDITYDHTDRTVFDILETSGLLTIVEATGGIHPEAGKFLSMARKYVAAGRFTLLDQSKKGDVYSFILKEKHGKAHYSVAFLSTPNGMVYLKPQFVEVTEVQRPGGVSYAAKLNNQYVNIDKWVEPQRSGLKIVEINRNGVTSYGVTGYTVKYHLNEMLAAGGTFVPTMSKEGGVEFAVIPDQIMAIIEESQRSANRLNAMPTMLHAAAALLAHPDFAASLTFSFSQDGIDKLIQSINYGDRVVTDENALPESARAPKPQDNSKPTNVRESSSPQRAFGFISNAPKFGRGNKR